MEEYVVVLKKGIDKFQFSREMILPNGEGSIPTREVRIANHRIVSKRLVNYYLTEEEALELLNDERVESISSQKMLNEVKPILHATQKGTFEKSADDDTIDETKMNWGLSRCIHRSDPFNNSSTTDQIEDEYNYTLTGKGVDIIIMDSGVDMNHKEFQNADGTSRVVDYDWRQLNKYSNVIDGKRTIHYSGQEPDVNTLTELNEGDLWVNTTGHSDLSSFKTAYFAERNDGDITYFDDFYIFDGKEWRQIISSSISGQTRLAVEQHAWTYQDEILTLIDATEISTLPHTIDVYYQDDQPTGQNVYDFWIDTNDGNKIYKYVGTPLTWSEIVQYSDKNNAFYDFGIALLKYSWNFSLDNSDHEINLWYGGVAPQYAEGFRANDLWHDGDDSWRTWNGTGIQSINYWSFVGTNLHDKLLITLPYIDTSNSGKIFTITYSNTAPPSPNEGDFWFDNTNYTRPASYNSALREEFVGDLHYWDASTTSWVMINSPLSLSNIVAGGANQGLSLSTNWSKHKYDLDSHGTSVASAACGNTMGFAKNATIYSLKMDGDGAFDVNTGYEIIKKFHRNKQVDPKTGYKRPTIVNMSFSTPQDGKEPYEISEVHYRGNTYTAAADGTNGDFTQGDSNNFKIPLKRFKYPNGSSTSSNLWPTRNYATGVLLEELIDEGVHVITSAGNEDRLIVDVEDEDYNNYAKLKSGSWWYSYDDKLYYNRKGDPYSENMVVVGSLSNSYKDENGQNVEAKAYDSNYGSGIDVYAPGEAILSAFTRDIFTVLGTPFLHPKINNDDNYQVFKQSGTSFAAPIVAGIVACLLEANPGMTPAQVKTWLRNNSTKDIMYDEGKDAVFTDRVHGWLQPPRNNKSVGGGGNRIVYIPFQRAKPLKVIKD